MIIEILWGARRSGKTTQLLENIGWNTVYIGTQWRKVAQDWRGVQSMNYTSNNLMGYSPKDGQTILLDDVESWREGDIRYLLSQSYSGGINIALTFTPPAYRLPRDHYLVSLARHNKARWLGGVEQSDFWIIKPEQLERYRQELTWQQFKTTIQGKLLLGGNTKTR